MDIELLIAEPTDDGIIEDLSKTNIREGEKRLMLALLENAIEDFQKYALANDTVEKELFQEAEVWFLAVDNDSLFSFENICEYLQVDSNYLRQGLLRWKTAQRKGHPSQSAASLKIRIEFKSFSTQIFYRCIDQFAKIMRQNFCCKTNGNSICTLR